MGVTYDGVILAAGRNTRLRGIVPSYYKPLVIVNGVPLIVSLVRNLWGSVERIVIVVSPENAGPISEIVEANVLTAGRVSYVVQPTARGPGEGVYRGLQAANADRIVLVCGDNSIPDNEISGAVSNDFGCVRLLDRCDEEGTITCATVITSNVEQASHFTRVPSTADHFIENAPGGAWGDGDYRCWIGPLIFNRRLAEKLFGDRVLSYKIGDPEIKISPVFNDATVNIRPLIGHSVDIGTSDALLESTSG
jgi:molybdopterin-guanine dinucleotide biosynthesis protein A